MTTADALRTFSSVQAELAAAACMLLDFADAQGDDMSANPITAETITNRQIRTLREEAMASGDYSQVDICNRALAKDGETQDQDGNDIAYADWTQDEARAECARVIADAAAQ